MNKNAFLIGMLIWVVLFGLGSKWVANPLLWQPASGFPERTATQTTQHFPHRLANLRNSNSTIGSYVDRITDEDSQPPPLFNCGDWAWRETRSRLVVFFTLWMASGFLLHWFVVRIFRGENELI